MTFNVYYTDRAQPDSSFVRRAWYDRDFYTLALELSGSVYAYQDVTRKEYEALVNSASPGTYYRNNIQGQKSGRRLGPVADLVEEAVGIAQNDKPTAAVVEDGPVEIKLHKGGYVTNGGNPILPRELSVYRSGTSVNDPKKIGKLSLTKDVVQIDLYEVSFSLSYPNRDEVSDVRQHSLRALSEDDAIEQVVNLISKVSNAIVDVVAVKHYFK